MAYTTIDKSTANFSCVTYTGNGSLPRAITGIGHSPDLVWAKDRDTAYHHQLHDSVRGVAGGVIYSSDTGAQDSQYHMDSFDTDGFTMGTDLDAINGNNKEIVSWNWLAGGKAPTKTYHVVVVSDSGNKYRFRDTADSTTFGASAVTLDLQEGGTYTFDVSDSTLNSHPFVIGTAANSSEYSTGVTYKLDGVTKTYSQYTSGFSAATSRQLIITVAASAPALYYWCSAHSGMGGAINTNVTHGSSNFDGNKQSLVSANSTSGFSIIKYSGSGSSSTIGHGLSSAPGVILVKRISGSDSWTVYHKGIGAGKYLRLDGNAAEASNSNTWANTAPTSTTFSVNHDDTNANGVTFVAYCFAEVPGYCKIGTYVGNGSTDGTFVYTGFKPSFILTKTTATDGWRIIDNKRLGYNPNNSLLQPNITQADSDQTWHDIMSNGFKLRTTDTGDNGNGTTYTYMAIGQSIVGSNNIPATAR
tara:strand:- start:45 stop:1460 length:1416 start_codon:yes stop_codon:yes gene_type:complete